MTVNFPPSPSPYAGRSRPDDPAAGRADDRTQTGAVHRGGVADIVRAEAGGSLQPPDVQAGQPSQNLFRTGGQVPLDAPPAGPLNGTVSKDLADKFQVVVGGADSASVSTPSDVSRSENFSFDAVLHLLLSVSVDEFKESQKQAQEDVAEKISELDASAQDLQTAANERLSGAIAAGAGAIVAGTLGVVAAGANFGGALRANSAIAADSGLTTVADKAAAFTQLTSSTTAFSGSAQSVGQGLQGGMGILQGEDDAQAAGDDTAKAEADKAAADDDSLHETALGMKQEYLSVMQDFLDKEKGWEQSQDQTMMNLARNV
jgi:hypothetical protein